MVRPYDEIIFIFLYFAHLKFSRTFLNSRIVLKTDQPHLFIISRNFLGGNKRSKMVFNMGSIMTGSTINIRKMRISVLSESKVL